MCGFSACHDRALTRWNWYSRKKSFAKTLPENLRDSSSSSTLTTQYHSWLFEMWLFLSMLKAHFFAFYSKPGTTYLLSYCFPIFLFVHLDSFEWLRPPLVDDAPVARKCWGLALLQHRQRGIPRRCFRTSWMGLTSTGRTWEPELWGKSLLAVITSFFRVFWCFLVSFSSIRSWVSEYMNKCIPVISLFKFFHVKKLLLMWAKTNRSDISIS